MKPAAQPIEEVIAREGGPAVSLAVVDDYELVAAEAYGADVETLFQAGSVSKPVSALTTLRLVEAGDLDLDADVNDVLVSWKVPGGASVTVRDLLGHTAGLGVEFFPGYPRGTAVPSLEQVLDGVPPAVTPPVRVEGGPASGFRYSGGGYAVLQLLLENATGIPFPDLAAELVLEPMGMSDSTFEQPLRERLQAVAAKGCWHVYPEVAAAGLWTTASDLARFVLGLQRALSGESGCLRRETAALMVEPRVALPPDGDWAALGELGIEPPDRFGLGLFVTGLGEHARFSHLGGTAGFFCGIVGSISDGSGAAVMTDADAHPVFFDAFLAIAAEYGWSGFRSPGT